MSVQPVPVNPGEEEHCRERTVWAMHARRYEATELGTARRLVAVHGQDLMYVADAGRWHTWDGRRWALDVTCERHRRVKRVVDGLLDEVRAESDDDRRKSLLRHFAQAQTHRVQNAIVALAQTESSVVATIADLDADPWALNVTNGTLDLRTGELRPHRREDRITKLAPVGCDPNAPCPRWEAFLGWACQDDESVVRYLRRLAGYSLTGDVSEQLLAFCHGGGANGKSTFLAILQSMLGLGDEGYALQAAPSLLISGRHDQHPTALADLVGRRLVVCTEVDEGNRFDEVLVKQLTGGDALKARFMRQDFFTFRPSGTFWLAANHKPDIRGTDHAIWRRIKLVPFNATVPNDERDPHLADKLRDELPGILAWAVRGCLEWQHDGLDTPPAVTSATDSYRADQDVIAGFLEDCCILGPDRVVGSTELHDAYHAWCRENGAQAVTQRALAPHLVARGLDRRKHSTTRRVQWHGLDLATPDTSHDEAEDLGAYTTPETYDDSGTHNDD